MASAQSQLKRIKEGHDPRPATRKYKRPCTVGSVYTHYNKSGPGRRIREARMADRIQGEIAKARDAAKKFLGIGGT